MITTLSSIFSFLSNSEMINDDAENIVNIWGITTIFSTMTQSLSNALDMELKKKCFYAADEYDKF